MTNDYIIDILKKYDKLYPNESIFKRTKILRKSKELLISRKNFLGHITASAFVLDITKTKILLIKYKILNKYIQPGGHIEASDVKIYLASKRELKEETGIKDIVYISFNKTCVDIPIDIDIHDIPENKNKSEPKHVHVDFRYLFILQSDIKTKMNIREITDITWMILKELINLNPDLNKVVYKI